jgi:hypothetical protein
MGTILSVVFLLLLEGEFRLEWYFCVDALKLNNILRGYQKPLTR